MLQGKVRAALQIPTDEVKGGPLHMDAQVSTDGETNTTVRDELLKKHPPGQPVNPKVLLPLPNFMPVTHPVVFDCLDGSTIRSTSLHTHSSAGPSGIDAVG